MGQLDEDAFDKIVRAGCAGCAATTFDIRSFIDRRLVLMLADPNDDGKWAHDGEKFVDGIYEIACASCRRVAFADTACPRCHAAGGLSRALGETSRMTIPKRCPKCNELELLALAMIPATARYTGSGQPKPEPLAEIGEPGFHFYAFACEACEAAEVVQVCPLCAAPGPLRPRP
jgi:hypothetical protein